MSILCTMASLSTAIVAWLNSHHGRKMARYTSVSIISTVVSFIVISLVYGFKIIKGEVDSTMFGNLVGAFPSYTLNRRWVWGKSGRSHFWKETLPFWALTLLGIAFAVVGASYARYLVHNNQWSHLFNTAVVVGANLACAAVLWILKFLVFNRIFYVKDGDEIEDDVIVEGIPTSEGVAPNAVTLIQRSEADPGF